MKRMHQNGTQKVYRYWNGLRGAHTAPARSDITPAALDRSLAHIFILDADEMSVRFRLAGTWLGSAFGHELTGHGFGALFDRDDRSLAQRVADAVRSEHTVAVFDLTAKADPERRLDMEMVLLPLSGAPSRILGAIHPCGRPFWLGAFPLGPARVTGVRLIDPDRPLFNLANRPAIPLASRRITRPTTAPRRLFRVIDGNRAAAVVPRARPPLHLIDGGRTEDDRR
jgi:hypothetical protein